jgi:ABC-type nickel/cobalt efflux system permease component RcnA
MAQQQRPPRLLLALLRGTEPGSSRSEFAYASSSSKRARLAAKAVAMFLAKTFLGRGGCEANDPKDKRYDNDDDDDHHHHHHYHHYHHHKDKREDALQN